MKNLMFILSLVLFASCSSDEHTFKVLYTGEKAKINTRLYHPGDTVVLRHSIINGWMIDDNWLRFNDEKLCLPTDSITTTCYYKAVVLDPVVESLE